MTIAQQCVTICLSENTLNQTNGRKKLSINGFLPFLYLISFKILHAALSNSENCLGSFLKAEIYHDALLFK